MVNGSPVSPRRMEPSSATRLRGSSDGGCYDSRMRRFSLARCRTRP
jgi:hypothetical protein